MLNDTPARTQAFLALLATLPWLLAPANSQAAEWEHWRASFSASLHLPDPGQVLRRQFIEDDGESSAILPSSGVLPVNSLPNAYKGLANGHHLLSFAHATEYPGAPRALYPGDVIEVDAGFSFHSFRLDALTAVGFDRRINVNAVTVDPANPDHFRASPVRVRPGEPAVAAQTGTDYESGCVEKKSRNHRKHRTHRNFC
jgi:hypothetical protein